MGNLDVMKTRFNEEIYKIKLKKGKNQQLVTQNEYYSFLIKVKASNDKISHTRAEIEG